MCGIPRVQCRNNVKEKIIRRRCKKSVNHNSALVIKYPDWNVMVMYLNMIAMKIFMLLLFQQLFDLWIRLWSRTWSNMVSMLVSVCPNMSRRSRWPMAMNWSSWFTQMALCLWSHFSRITLMPSSQMSLIFVQLMCRLESIDLRLDFRVSSSQICFWWW